MKKISLMLLAPALCAGLAWSLFAQEAPPTGTAGKVLLLQNERAFEGDIVKIGESFRIRKGGGETVIPAAQALRLCADWNEAVAFMRSRANLDDPDERLRLAKWCHLNRQIEHARAEARRALAMRPKHAATRQFVKLLEVTSTAKNVQPAAEPAPPPIPQIDLSFEAVTAFTLKVQPILMNTCVNCHSGTHKGSFRLYRLHSGADRVATQRNLAAVLAQVQLDKPAASPLFFKALSAHGDAKTAPIPGKQSPTFVTLCNWLEQTIADNPHLHDKTVTLPPAKLPRAVSSAPPVITPINKGEAGPGLPGVVVSSDPPSPVRQRLPVAPTVVESPADEFSAAFFNRYAHPSKK
jgi:hypothetical protein